LTGPRSARPLFASTLALALSSGLYGCPQNITSADDDTGSTPAADCGTPENGDARSPGTDGASRADAASPSDATLGDSGDAGDAGDLRDAGRPLDSGINTVLRPLRWGEMTLPASTRLVASIWGRSNQEIYAGTQGGKLLRFDSAGQAWSQVWAEPNNFGIQALWGTATTLFVAGETTLYVHTGGTIEPQPRSYSVGTHIHGMHGRGDNEVYLVADQTNGRGFYRYNGQRVTPISEPTDIARLSAVYATAAGPVFVGGNGAPSITSAGCTSGMSSTGRLC
jgi:hypothetical protein